MQPNVISERFIFSLLTYIPTTAPVFALAMLPMYAHAAPIGPGTITTPVTQASGDTTTIRGDTTIAPSGAGTAVTVSNGIIELDGPNIVVKASGTGYGFNIDGTSALTSLVGTTDATLKISTLGSTFSYGIWAHNPNQINTGNMVDVSNVSISTVGNGSIGVVFNQYAKGVISNLDIVTTGSRDPGNNNAGAYGISLQNSSQGTFDNVKIVTNGVGSSGLLNTDSSIVTIDTINIKTNAASSYGFNTQLGGVANIKNLTLETMGTSSTGILNTGLATFNGDNINLKINGDSSYGLNTQSGSSTKINNASIHT